MRFLAFMVLVFFAAMPVWAEAPLTATEVENLPFDNSLANTPNTTLVGNEIDMSQEVEHADSHGAKKEGLPQFDATTFTSQLFWLAIAFAIMYVYFAKSSLPALSKVIDTRKTTVRNDINEANRISLAVDDLQKSYEDVMNQARLDARAAAVAVETAMRDKADEQSLAFKHKSMEDIRALEKRAEASKNKIKSDLEQIAATLTSDIVTKLSGLNLDEKDVANAVRAQVDNKGGTPTQRKKAA